MKEQATARSLDSFSLLMDQTTGGSARSSSQSPRHGRRRRPPSSSRRRRRTTREVIFSFLFLPSFIPLSCPNIHAHCKYYFLCYLLSLCSSPSSCSEDRKPLYRTDPATSTSFNTSSSRYTSVAPILLPSPLLILFNHRRCVSSQHNSAPSRVGIPLHPSFLLFSFLNLSVDTFL